MGKLSVLTLIKNFFKDEKKTSKPAKSTENLSSQKSLFI